MADFNVWLLIAGLTVGAAVTWLVIGTISRSDDELAAAERASEAEWIARTIEQHGGHAPVDLVAQVLLLHRRYLQGRAGAPLPEAEAEQTGPAAEPPAQPGAAVAYAPRGGTSGEEEDEAARATDQGGRATDQGGRATDQGGSR